MLPGITKEGMIEIDRIMVEDLDIPVELMMEHAGLNLAKVVVRFLTSKKDVIVVIAGSGNNGGGGITCARKLKNWGYEPLIYLPKGSPKNEIPNSQFERARKAGVNAIDSLPKSVDVVIDAYIGYNFSGNIRESDKPVISFMKNNITISLDIPTGIDSNTGEDKGLIHPKATVTLAWVKTGIMKINKEAIGQLFLVDIGVPSFVYYKEELYEEAPPTDKDLSQITKAFSISSYIEITHNRTGWKIK